MRYFFALISIYLLSLITPESALAQATIKFDPGNRALIQFDQAFNLQVDSVKMGTIQKVSVYEVQYKNGISKLIDRTNRNSVLPSFVLTGAPGFTLNGTSLKISMPALRPDRDFDLLITAHFSTAHLKQALQINKDLYKNKGIADVIVRADPTLSSEYNTLFNAINQIPANSPYPITVFNYDLITYRGYVYGPLEPLYDKLFADANYKFPDDLNPNDIKALYTSIAQPILMQYKVAALRNTVVHDTLVKVFKGIITANYHLPAVNCDPFDLEKRLSNLKSSMNFVDSLKDCVELIKDAQPVAYPHLLKVIKDWSDDLNINYKFLKTTYDQITKSISDKSQESMWLAQGTRAGDLKTTSNRHFTLDVGMADLMVYDNSNKHTHIPKLFFGLNYYFRSMDKNADWSKIPEPPADSYNHNLESRYSVWQRLSLTAGFTLGAMQNKDFDNVYNSLSFTLGPSYRIGKILKISAGGALLKRIDTEPIRTHSSVILGSYVSLALDYDLLTAASKIGDMLFK